MESSPPVVLIVDDHEDSHAGILLLTGHTGAAVRQQAEDVGCDGFVVKPCMPGELALEIRHVLVARGPLPAATM